MKKASKRRLNVHIEADDLLCEELIELGREDLVEAWKKVSKWYA